MANWHKSNLQWTAAVCALLVAAQLSPAAAETAPSPNSPGPPACATAEFRQFDFWLGDWEVRNPAGKKVGENRITTILWGCVLLENWSSTSGVIGTSNNIYAVRDHKWHQTWVDSSGDFLHLVGEFRNGKMVLVGQTPVADKPGQTDLQRITWETLADGRVRQLWDTAADAGKNWTVAFEGYYSKKHK